MRGEAFRGLAYARSKGDNMYNKTRISSEPNDLSPRPSELPVHARINAELKKAVLVECQKRGISLKQVIEHYLREFLKDYSAPAYVCLECGERVRKADAEQGASGDHYCKPCYRKITSEAFHGVPKPRPSK